MTDRYAVMGNPIAHSKSPLIHAQFARQTGQSLEYQAILVDLAGFNEAVAEFQQQRGRGLNITVPFKQQAWQLADQRTPRAERAGAVNTLWFEHGTIHADNTDGAGLVKDLQSNHHCLLETRRILLLGAGGAARGVMAPLLDARPECLVIANRTASRAVDLAAEYAGDSDTDVAGCGYHDLDGQSYDVVINATAASLDGEVPPLPDTVVAETAWCYDMMYAAQATAFMRWARQRGVQNCVDGLGMLVEQAAESFFIWRGIRPQTGPVIQQLRKQLNQADKP